MRVLEGESHSVAPRTRLASVMDLVKHGIGCVHEGAQRTRRCGDLLISHDHAVNVRRQGPVARGPLGIKMQVKAFGGMRPLLLKVLGRYHDHAATDPTLKQRASDGEQCEGGLARTRGAHQRHRNSPFQHNRKAGKDRRPLAVGKIHVLEFQLPGNGSGLLFALVVLLLRSIEHLLD